MNRSVQARLSIIALVACAACSPARTGRLMASEDLTCMQQTTYGGGLVITMEDARKIRAALDRYLPTVKKELQKEVVGPGDPFIDCWGTVRMGIWLLERPSEGSELHAIFPVLHNDNLRIDQTVVLRRAGEGWEASGVGLRTAHALVTRP